MSHCLYRIAAVLFVAVSISACANSGGYGNSESNGYGYGKPAKASKERAPQTVTVAISNFAFEPATITIAPGDTVVFVNQDSAPHTATHNGAVFDTGTLATGQSGSITIDESGSYDYLCTIHPSMKGTVVVQ